MREERMRVQAQKMKSLEVLAGGVAHDFNNILTAILGAAHLLKMGGNLTEDDLENLAIVEEAAWRGVDVCSRILAFSHGGVGQYARLDLRDVVDDAVRQLVADMVPGISVRVESPPAPVMVEGDQAQLTIALHNVLTNALDVLTDGGRIEIELKDLQGEAVIRVHDTGQGMDESVRERVFEPFFTTKPLGSGAGLGLAITYGIAQGHRGRVSVDSAPGQGSTFTISIPRQ